MPEIALDVWLYGNLAFQRSGEPAGFAHLQIHLPEKSTLSDLLTHLGISTNKRGITFINGKLSAMLGLQPDLGHTLRDGDRVAFFDLKSMWPFQYRHGAVMTEEMAQAMVSGGRGLRHTFHT